MLGRSEDAGSGPRTGKGESMTNATATASQKSFTALLESSRKLITWLIIAAIAFLLGMYVVAPAQQRAQPTHLPASYVGLPTGVITLQGEEGRSVLLPVRIADTSQARMVGFREVGETALANQFLLYAQTRQTSGRSSYSVEKVRVPLELAAIDGEGNVVAIVTTTVGQERAAVTQPHRWVLAAKSGTFTHYGIVPGMKLDTESIQKINL
jgi:uncharacterized membrane protein (UPF0127 family)